MSRLRGFPPIFGEIASIVVWAFRKSASFRPRKPPALRAVVPARAHKSARAFSCTIFDPSVLVGASSISLASPQAAKLAHFAAPPLHPATDVLGRGVGSAIQPQHGVEIQLWTRMLPRQLKARTAAHRRSSGAFLLCQEFRHPLPLRSQLQFLHLVVVVFVNHLLDGAESKA